MVSFGASSGAPDPVAVEPSTANGARAGSAHQQFGASKNRLISA
jgi:hypothetical protein